MVEGSPRADSGGALNTSQRLSTLLEELAFPPFLLPDRRETVRGRSGIGTVAVSLLALQKAPPLSLIGSPLLPCLA